MAPLEEVNWCMVKGSNAVRDVYDSSATPPSYQYVYHQCCRSGRAEGIDNLTLLEYMNSINMNKCPIELSEMSQNTWRTWIQEPSRNKG